MLKSVNWSKVGIWVISLFISEALRMVVPAYRALWEPQELFVWVVVSIIGMIVWGIVWFVKFRHQFRWPTYLLMIYLTFISAAVAIYGFT